MSFLRTRTLATVTIVASALVIVRASMSSLQQPGGAVVESAADLAVGLVQSGHSAGMIIRLPTALDSTLATEQSLPNGFLINQSPFGVWIRSVSSANNIPGLVAPGQAEAAITGFAVRAGWHAAKWRGTPTYLLKSPLATACAAKLLTPLPTAVENRNVVDLVTSAIHVATKAKVPGGYVGSCIGATEFAPNPVALAAGQSLEDALSNAVNRFGNAVWVAVEDAHAHCSLGIIRRAEAGGACKTAITATLDPSR
jgi:hypothetical protein